MKNIENNHIDVRINAIYRIQEFLVGHVIGSRRKIKKVKPKLKRAARTIILDL